MRTVPGPLSISSKPPPMPSAKTESDSVSLLGTMRMEDPKPTFAHFVSQAKKMFPDLAYLHTIEPRISGGAKTANATIWSQTSSSEMPG